jgi:hypothetical protein
MHLPIRAFAALACIAALLILTACRSGVAGEYTCDLGPVNGIILGSGGKASASSPLTNRVAEGTYEVDGDKVTVRIGNSAVQFTHAHGVLSSREGQCTKK